MLSQTIFKANDIRGLAGGSPAEWDADGAYALGAAYVRVLGLAGKSFVMARDMRTTGVVLSEAFARGAMDQGADVVDIGLASTDGLYFAAGHLDLPGVMFTASHNPATYNGIKLCHAQALPIEPDELLEIARLALEGAPEPATDRGQMEQRDLLPAYAEHLRSLVDLSGIRRLRVVVDAGNGMGGHTTPAVLSDVVDVVGLFMDLDGSFPNHQPNPLEPQNLVDAQKAVVEHQADCALVFDGDADRCFIIDETGAVVSPSIITALVARDELQREPGGTIVVNTITSQVVGEVVEAAGGTLVVSRVGHTYMKSHMAEHHAIFGGEHSAHYYFREFWGADTGMLAALHVLKILGSVERPLSDLVGEYSRYVPSGEINSAVKNPQAAMERVAAVLRDRGEVDDGDGLMVRNRQDRWWVSVRASNTEPLLRLNVEAPDEHTMVELRDLALGLIRQEEL